MLSPQKLLAASLPLGVFAVMLVNSLSPLAMQGATIGADTTHESPAQLRLTALDAVLKGDKHSALDLYEEAVRLATAQFGADSTFLGDLYYEAGQLYLDLDQFNQAEDYLRQAVKINPKNASARLAMAKLLDREKKVQDSIGQIREALMINPSSPVARQRFIHTLSKYGQSPSDKAIASQEAVTLASMQKQAREALMRSVEQKKNSASQTTDKKAMGDKRLSVPVLPKNLAPLAEDAEGKGKESSGGHGTTAGASTSISKPTPQPETAPPAATEPKADSAQKAESSKPSSALSLFPLQNLSERKKNEELNKEIKARAQKRMEDAVKNGGKENVIDKIKEQARQQEKAREREKEKEKEKDREKEKARAAKARASTRPSGKSEKPAGKEKAEPAGKEEKAPAQEAPVQQAAPQQMMQPYMPVFQQPVFTPPPKTKHGPGFVPPPPPTMPMYPGVVPQVIPQVIPAQQAKPAAKPAAKPKEKPKAAPEAAPVEDKPPPMTSGPADDPDFLLDWSETKAKGKKGKAK